MKLTVDIGNTRVKWALFDGERLVREGVGLPFPEADRAVWCATGEVSDEVRQALPANALELKGGLGCRLPIALDYLTPETLGADRVAAACGAWKLSGGRPCVVIDAGTCITIDYLDASGTYRGGAILPGISMKFRSLHTFTAKLPLLGLKEEIPGRARNEERREEIPGQARNEERSVGAYPRVRPEVTGRSTAQSIMSGVLTATRFAVEGYVDYYRMEEPGVVVFLTGGDAEWLSEEIPDQARNEERRARNEERRARNEERRARYEEWRVVPELVMVGLNEIENG